MAQINLGVALNFDDSQYKSGVKSVEQSLKKFSTTPAFVKLKLDDTDFRKQFQPLIDDYQKKLSKLGALTYYTSKGKKKEANTIGTMQTAYKYFLEQSNNETLSNAERNAYKKKEQVMREYLNLLKEIGLETKGNAQLERDRANMPARLEKARMTAQVAAERQRAYRAQFSDEREAKKSDELFRRRWAHEFQQWNKKDAELAKLQKEADARARSAANEYNKHLNRVANGGSSSSDLADLRRQFKEQERVANNEAKKKERQERIAIAMDNERIARDAANAARSKTNSDRTEKNIRREIKALNDLKKAEDALDRSQGKRARNARKNSSTNQRIAALRREANALRDAAIAERERNKIA